jgi:hypothetical protein
MSAIELLPVHALKAGRDEVHRVEPDGPSVVSHRASVSCVSRASRSASGVVVGRKASPRGFALDLPGYGDASDEATPSGERRTRVRERLQGSLKGYWQAHA